MKHFHANDSKSGTSGASGANRHLRAALAYAKLGWHVLPLHSVSNDGACSCGKNTCGSAGKHPRTKHGVTNATVDEKQITEWWTRYPAANIGVATGAASGLVALDIDPRHGGAESLGTLLRKHGELPQTVVSLTGGGGQHVLFAYPADGTRIRNATGFAGLSGLDIRGDGGYIVVPPSCHLSGNTYEWETQAHPLKVAVAPMPDWLHHLMAEPPEAGQTRSSDSTRVATIPEGQRNATLTSLAGSMRHRGAGYEAIYAALEQENSARCKPPLSKTEVEAIARSVSRYEPTAPERDGSTTTHVIAWPDPPRSEAFHGLAGDFVRAIEPHSESDPVALLLQFLVLLGNVVGRGPHFTAEAEKHYLNLFVGLVGMTSKGRKGSAWSQIKRVFDAIEPDWANNRIVSGLSSGEGLIWAVRDPVEKEEPTRDAQRRITGYEALVTDHGAKDKRVVAVEKELASTLRVLGRDGNNLSAVLRQAWETGDLRVLTKNSPVKATGAHISVIGHITKDEHLRYLDRTEIANGFANRFLWGCVSRSKILPEGGRIHEVNFTPLIEHLGRVIEISRSVDELRRDDEARELWAKIYPALSEGKPGLLGAVTSRAEAQVMRLACLYALLDLPSDPDRSNDSRVIRVPHLQAALALWDYCEASCRFIFGDSLGDPVADQLRDVLRSRSNGMSRTEIRDHFNRHRTAAEIDKALTLLLELGAVRRVTEQTGGHPSERWLPVAPATEAT